MAKPIRILNRRVPRGFSLVELLVAALIALIIFAIGFVTISGTIRARGEATTRVRSAENARLFFQLFERDLSAAWSGPRGMTRTVADISAIAATPGTLVLRDNYATKIGSTLNTIDTDIIQCFTRADTVSAGGVSPDRDVFSRYYVNTAAATLCRQVFEDDTGTLKFETTSFSRSASQDQNALFEDVRQLLVDLYWWDDSGKMMEKLGPGNADRSSIVRTPTHISVALVLYDRYAEERLKNDPTADPLGFSKIQSFSKTFPIPTGF